MQVRTSGDIQVDYDRGNPSARGLAWLVCLKTAMLSALLSAVLAWPSPGFSAQAPALSKDNLACLACHDKQSLAKKLDNGEVLSLSVSAKAFLGSKHGETDCTDCHSALDDKTHGKAQARIEGRRAYALSMQPSCRDCHKKNFIAYEESLHAKLSQRPEAPGQRATPLCADCHNPHEVRSTKNPVVLNAVSCARCHEGILQAYTQDVHGRSYQANNPAAPICATCHQAHTIKAAALDYTARDACLACHKDALAQHKDWLPNASRHFDAISCPVCHAPDAQRRVNLRLFDKSQSKQAVEKLGVPQFAQLVGTLDAANTGLGEQALWSLLKEYNSPTGPTNFVLRGRLEVSSGVQAHQLSDKARAIRDCGTCHKAGAQAFQSVSLTIADPAGRPVRHAVQKEVLTSLLATQSVSGFYAIGSTRIKLLDALLVLVLLGACSVPLAHASVKRLFKSHREKLIRERANKLAADGDSTRD